MSGSGPQVINPAKSPPIYLPIGLMVAGLVSLLLLQLLLIVKAPMIFGEYRYNSATLTATHLFTLGFATTVMMGAFYQLTPVMLIAQAVKGSWATGQGLLYLIGAGTLIAGFYYGETLLVIWGGSIVVVTALLFAALVGRTMRTATSWTISGSYMIAGLSFFIGTVLWGLILGLNLRFNFLGDTLRTAPLSAHLVLGLGGWFMLTIFGVTYQLIPMFALSSKGDLLPARQSLWLLTAGLWLTFALLALGLPEWLAALSLLPVLAGIVRYAVDMAGIFRSRRRPALDLSMRYARVSFSSLAVSLVLGLLALSGLLPGLAQTPAPTGIVWFGLVGFVGSMILGMLYKIIPFLIWHRLLKNRTNKAQKLPTLEQMYTPALAEAGFRSWATGILGTGLILLAGGFGLVGQPALLVRWPLLLLALGSLLFTWTIGQVLRAKPLSD